MMSWRLGWYLRVMLEPRLPWACRSGMPGVVYECVFIVCLCQTAASPLEVEHLVFALGFHLRAVMRMIRSASCRSASPNCCASSFARVVIHLWYRCHCVGGCRKVEAIGTRWRMLIIIGPHSIWSGVCLPSPVRPQRLGESSPRALRALRFELWQSESY